MPEYTARLASKDDIPRLVEWIHANRKQNHYDPEIFQYDSTRVMAADKDGEPVCYLPFQFTILTDALAPEPARTKEEIAQALKAVIHEVVRLAKKSKIGEIYFLCDPADTETKEFAEAHGYEELNLRVMRLKPRNLNPPLPEEAA